MEVGEIAPPASGDTDFFGDIGGVLDDNDAAPALSGGQRAHQSGSSGTYDDYIGGHVWINTGQLNYVNVLSLYNIMFFCARELPCALPHGGGLTIIRDHDPVRPRPSVFLQP